jgi:Spy/CpxP family protein refolding chaperone
MTISRWAGFVFAAALFIAGAGSGMWAQGAQGGAGAPGGGPGVGRRGGPGGPMGRGGPMGPGAIDLPLAQLNLTAQQRDQIKTIMESHQDEMKTLASSEMSARQGLEQAVSADTLDEATIRQRAANLGAIEADTAVARAHLRAEVWQVLTADQQKQAKTLEAARPAPGRGRGPGGA